MTSQKLRVRRASLDIGTYPLEPAAILNKAASASGVYMICTRSRWVYVGESDDVQQSLFEYLNEPRASFDRFGPLSFSSEMVAVHARRARRDALAAALEPACVAK
jgi:hypothetical protein